MENIRNLLIVAASGLVMLLILVILGVNIHQTRQLKNAANVQNLREEMLTAMSDALSEEFDGLTAEELDLLKKTVEVELQERLGSQPELDIEVLTKDMKKNLLAEGLALTDEQVEHLKLLMEKYVQEGSQNWEYLAEQIVTNESEQRSRLEKLRDTLQSGQEKAVQNLQDWLAELGKRVTEMDELLQEHQDELQIQAAVIEDMKGQLDENLIGIGGNAIRLDAAETRFGQIEEVQQDHEGRIFQLETAVEENSGRIDAQRETLDQCFSSVSSGKELLASTLTDYGIDTDADSSFSDFASQLSSLHAKAYSEGYAAGFAENQSADVKITEIHHSHQEDCTGTLYGSARAHWQGPVGGINITCPKCGHWSDNCITYYTWYYPDGSSKYWGSWILCSKCQAIFNDRGQWSGYYGGGRQYSGDTDVVIEDYAYTGYVCGYHEGEIIGFTILKNS